MNHVSVCCERNRDAILTTTVPAESDRSPAAKASKQDKGGVMHNSSQKKEKQAPTKRKDHSREVEYKRMMSIKWHNATMEVSNNMDIDLFKCLLEEI